MLTVRTALTARTALYCARRRKGISGSRKGVEEEEAGGAASAAAAGGAAVPRMPKVSGAPPPTYPPTHLPTVPTHLPTALTYSHTCLPYPPAHLPAYLPCLPTHPPTCPLTLTKVVERSDADSAASTPRSKGDDTTEDDRDAPISMRGMRLSLQASQANLLSKLGDTEGDGGDDDWDDD